MKTKEFKVLTQGLPQLNQEQRDMLEEKLRELNQEKEVAELLNTHSSPIVCPHCACEALQKYGRAHQMQRYRCKACRRTFNRLTNTPFSRLRKKEKWLGAINSLEQGESVRKMATHLSVNPKTAFRWRHRFLQGFAGKGQPNLGGIVEADETFFRISEKGNRRLERKPRKRGEVAKTAGLSQEEFVTAWIARDRNKTTIYQVTSHRDTYFVKQLLGSRIEKDSILCTDGKRGYAAFARKNNIQHVVLNLSRKERVKESVYHIQNVNNYHARLKNWIAKFNGVGSKYLGNYLEWFRLLSRISENLVSFESSQFLKMAVLHI